MTQFSNQRRRVVTLTGRPSGEPTEFSSFGDLAPHLPEREPSDEQE